MLRLTKPALNRISRNGGFKPVTPRVVNRYSKSSCGEYARLSEQCSAGERAPYVVLDSKSMPRSGLHYLKNTLQRILGKQFTFCEWYQEPGCCGRMPCALTVYSQVDDRQGGAHVRLVKSHDLHLDDPVYESGYSLRRLILVRDPLFVLTSWFALEQLRQYKSILDKSGIRMEKIWLSHEPQVVEAAYRILDEKFVPAKTDQLEMWLQKKVEYSTGFMAKWVKPTIEKKGQYGRVVEYSQINTYVNGFLDEIREYLSDDALSMLDDFKSNQSVYFKAKSDPFVVQSGKLTQYLLENSDRFAVAAEKIRSVNPEMNSVE